MNFSSILPGTNDYHKLMMQKHLDQKKTRRDYTSMRMMQPTLNLDFKKTSQQNKQNATQSLQRAGQTLINNSFANSSILASSPRPKQVDQETQKMKKLQKERLKESLLQQQQRKKLEAQEQRKLGKVMSVQNGMLDYLQKQIQKRNEFINSCIAKQENREKGFVDQNLRRHQNAINLIEHNYDVDVFNHESDRYQQKQKINFQKMIETNFYQTQINKINKQYQKGQYRKYLDPRYPQQKHNPITNPKPVHYQDNIYINKLISKY